MSRIGKSPITIPAGVELDINKNNLVTVKGAKGTLTQQIDTDLKVNLEDGVLSLERPTESNRHKSMHGLYRSLINNMIIGVTDGYAKELELIGVGFRASNTGNLLEMQLGYSHPIYFAIPEDLVLETITEKGKNPLIKISGIDKQLVGQVAAKIKAYRKPEPYKGKGIRYKGEEIRRKVGKSAGA